MNAKRPAGHVPEEREAKHEQANSDVRGIWPSLPENWRHADLSANAPRGERALPRFYPSGMFVFETRRVLGVPSLNGLAASVAARWRFPCGKLEKDWNCGAKGTISAS
jgi:hypothetical protein